MKGYIIRNETAKPIFLTTFFPIYCKVFNSKALSSFSDVFLKTEAEALGL